MEHYDATDDHRHEVTVHANPMLDHPPLEQVVHHHYDHYEIPPLKLGRLVHVDPHTINNFQTRDGSTIQLANHVLGYTREI